MVQYVPKLFSFKIENWKLQRWVSTISNGKKWKRKRKSIKDIPFNLKAVQIE